MGISYKHILLHTGTQEVQIVQKRGDSIELNCLLDYWVIPSNNDSNCHVDDDQRFFNGLNGISGGSSLTLRAISGYIVKSGTHRPFNQSYRPIREKVSYYLDLPELPSALIPKFQTGEEVNVMHAGTIPTAKEWRNRISKKEFFQYAEAEPIFDADTGVYEVRIKETQYI